MSQEKTTKEKLLEKLYSLSHNVIWEIEASREIEGKSFIKPSDLKRITELIDNISNDVEKTISQTREETIKEVKESLPKAQKIIKKDWLGLDYTLGDVKYREHAYRLLVLDILNKLKK